MSMRICCFLSIILLSIQTISAQLVTVDSLEMPKPGDLLKYRFVMNYQGMYTDTGPDYVWNFSNLNSSTEVVDTFVSVNSTNLAYMAVFNNPFYPNQRATVAQPQQTISNPFIDITDAYNFYKNTSQRFTQLGIGAKINGVPVPLKYNKPDILYQFPITYLHADTSESEYHINIPDFGYYGQTKYRTNLVDGWGKLYLPVNTFDVVRVKSIVKYRDTVYIDSIGYGFTFTHTETEYKWFTDSIRGPVLEIVKRAMNTASVKYYYNPPPNYSIDENYSKTISIFPNPANDFIFFKMPENTEYCKAFIFDVTGKVLYENSFYNFHNPLTINILEFQQGLYFVKIITHEGIYSGKFAKF